MPELIFKSFLDETGASYVYQPKLFGHPDFLVNGHIVIFIDNAFWHGRGNLPINNRDYWEPKLKRNRERDEEVDKRLREEGYRVIRIDDKAVIRMLKDFKPNVQPRKS
jgi:DNA mismatch endonuclease (patch repair protein)